MDLVISRRAALAAFPVFVPTIGLMVAGARAGEPLAAAHKPGGGSFPRQSFDLVREVVGASHRDLEKVKSLVDAHPALANCAYDWGFGDWETPLGAASHTGRRAIGEYLLSMGARPDIFCAAAMGHLETVRAMIGAMPGVQRTRGPHGITLMAHARAGGEPAAAVAAYLETVEGADDSQTSLPLTAEERKGYLGTYSFGDAETERFEIIEKRGMLAVKAADGSDRALFRTGEHEFHPTSARAVRFRFAVESGRATGVSITDADLLVKARRVEG